MKKAILVLCAQALLVQCAFSQCVEVGAPSGCSQFVPAASLGGSFVVTSSSPIAPVGISLISSNVYKGTLVAGGELPLLGSVSVEGSFPSEGTGAVSYGYGDGVVGIATEEGPIETGIAAPTFAVAPGYALGAGYGLGQFGYGNGFGCGNDFVFGLGQFGCGNRFGYGNGFIYGNGCGYDNGFDYGQGYGCGYGIGYGQGYGCSYGNGYGIGYGPGAYELSYADCG